MAHTTEIVLPQSFVVLQGVQGDGMRNTIDSVPIVLTHHNEADSNSSSDDAGVVVVDFHAEGASLASSSGEHVPASLPTIHQSPLTTLDPMLASTNMPPLALNPLTSTTTNIATNTTATSSLRRSTLDHDSFIVVDENEHQHSRAEECAIEAWNLACRSREVRQRQEWLDHQHHFHFHHSPTTIPYSNDWWQTDGRLNIFQEVPTRNNVMLSSNVIGALSPGSTVVGTEMIYLNAESLQVIPPQNEQDEHAMGVPNQVQLLKLQENGGYVVLSINGYSYLGPGVLQDYCSPQAWIWKVTYSGGAFVREGLELNSLHIATLPYGSLCRVSRKTISTDGGLSRLWVHAVVNHDEGATPVEGWISEYLNPTSTTGERGPIVQPVPFPVPAVYQVALQEGALIRSDVELSSKRIGHAPCGAALQIVGRAFSEHPQDQCIERLKLAGNGGWVSVRLNELPPNDALVFRFLRIDDSFDVDHPGMFHLHAQSDVDQEVNTDFEGADLSSIDESHESSSSSIIRGGVATDGPMRHGYSEGNCIACLSEERNATIVHGETGHIACCLVCARILKAQGKDCPVCRLPIDSVIQHFWA